MTGQPFYRGALIYTCADCGGDLDDEGLGMYYCPGCRAWLPFSYVVGDDDD